MSLDGTAGVMINGEHRRVPAGTSLAQLIAEVGLDPVRVAVERNLEIVPRSTFGQIMWQLALDGLTRSEIRKVDEAILFPGERLDVIARLPEPGLYCMISRSKFSLR